jgi:hypothetical protein
MLMTDPSFIAFNREAELAKRLACSGLTALRKATPSRPGIYYDAFFGISNALERFGKLAWLIDECTQRNGAFPTDQDLKKVGHDIEALVKKATLIASKHGQSQPFPSDDITDHIIKFLSTFLERTRYYNIDFFVGGKSKGMGDPIKLWHAKVGAAILATPEMKAKRQRWRAQAQQVANLMSPAIVFSTSAQGTSLSTVAELSVSESEAKEINKQAQWKLLTIVRYLCLLIADLAGAAQAEGHSFIPDMREHFGFFCGDDAILHRYATWPPRGIT